MDKADIPIPRLIFWTLAVLAASAIGAFRAAASRAMQGVKEDGGAP